MKNPAKEFEYLPLMGMLDDSENIEETQAEDLYEHHRIVADPKQSLMRIDKFLMVRLDKVSRNKIQNAIRAGSIIVNNDTIKPNYKIKPGDIVSIVLPKPLEEVVRPKAENIPLDIRYEDEDVMVLYKPPGMVVHPGVGNYSGTLVNALAYYFGNSDMPIKEGSPENRLGLVHRIDKDTSGLLVIAKTDYAMTHLAKQFFHHTIYRRYWALVWGEPAEDSGTIATRIGRHPRHRMSMAVYDEFTEGGKDAVTHFSVLEKLYYVTLIECRLETGRTHQIRVHMSHMGHPIFSDPRYGGDKIVKGTIFSKYKKFVENCFELIPRQALHAKSLGFVHPTTGKEMYFDSELPEDFQRALEKWRNYLASRKELPE